MDDHTHSDYADGFDAGVEAGAQQFRDFLAKHAPVYVKDIQQWHRDFMAARTAGVRVDAAPQSQPMPPRLLQSLARRNFRAPTDMDDLIAMAANIIAEDGCVIERLQAKLAHGATEAFEPCGSCGYEHWCRKHGKCYRTHGVLGSADPTVSDHTPMDSSEGGKK